MPNINYTGGLRPVQNIGTASYDASCRQYSVPASDATAIFIGDPVRLVGTSQLINGQIFADVAQAATGNTIVGVVVGVLADNRDSLVYRAASTQRILIVCDDPNAVYEIQQGTGGTALTANDIGLNANFAVGTGNTVTGQSAVTLNNATGATTNTLDLKIVGMPNRIDNDFGASVSSGMDSSRFYVRINRHQYVNQIAGV